MGRFVPPRRPTFLPGVEFLEDRTLLSGSDYGPPFLYFSPRFSSASPLPPAIEIRWRLEARAVHLTGRLAASPQAKVVKAVYRKYLRRAPTPAELKKALRSLARGGTAEQLETKLLGSPEYFRKRARGIVDRFLTVAARDALGQSLDGATLQELRQMLRSGASRTSVAALILRLRTPVTNPPLPSPDIQPPQVVFNTPSSGQVTATNVTVTGQAADDGSGVASLQAQVDGERFVAVAVDAAGNFRFDTTLPLDGTADGSHTLRLRATDGAGNVSTLVERSFTLDTTAPPSPWTSLPRSTPPPPGTCGPSSRRSP